MLLALPRNFTEVTHRCREVWGKGLKWINYTCCVVVIILSSQDTLYNASGGRIEADVLYGHGA